MKTTLELPETLVLEATDVARKNGLPLGEFVAEAIHVKLLNLSRSSSKPWMKHFGSLRHLHGDTLQMEKNIHTEFENIDEQGWQ